MISNILDIYTIHILDKQAGKGRHKKKGGTDHVLQKGPKKSDEWFHFVFPFFSPLPFLFYLFNAAHQVHAIQTAFHHHHQTRGKK